MGIYKTIKVISEDENGVIWVESELGTVFGIVHGNVILDAEGLIYHNCGSTLVVIARNFDCDIVRDCDSDSDTIHCECGGRLLFSGWEVTYFYAPISDGEEK